MGILKSWNSALLRLLGGVSCSAIVSIHALLCLFVLGCGKKAYNAPGDPLFVTVPSSASGIMFRNDVTDDSLFNEMNYRNFYNGGGVAVGDINNDGLPDVFLTANQGPNKLFLNKGHFTFEDITQSAGITKGHKWSTGVTMADVNGDGLLDIYVCSAGNIIGDVRKNELFINQGNLHFKEEAEKYNLQDSAAYHTQASFFDYDSDGDLDVFLLNNDCAVPTGNFPTARVREMRDPVQGDKLLRNENGVFKDVSADAGIFGSNIGFGLGVATADINGDNWPDLYISNDFFEKDYLYINQQNGTFKEVSDSVISHMSQSSMGADAADINNDGLMDIFCTDMLPEDDYRLKKNTAFEDYDTYQAKYTAGFHRQMLSNTLQLNNGDNTFSEVAQLAGVNATDWSWGALIFDLNNDGWKDIVVCNGMYLDVTDQDYINYNADQKIHTYFQEAAVVSDYQKLKAMIASTPLPNYAFINERNLTFKNRSYELGLGEPSYSNGAAYADLDNDGDLDLIVNNLNSEAFVYRNKTTEKSRRSFLSLRLQGEGLNPFGIGASVTLYTNGVAQTAQNFSTRGFQSSIEPVLFFGLDSARQVDSLVVIWPSFKKQVLKKIAVNKELIVKENEANERSGGQENVVTPFFEEVTAGSFAGNIMHRENDYVDFNAERLMPHMISEEGPKLAVADINGDRLEDFFIGGARGDTGKLFVQTPQGTFKPLLQPALVADRMYEDVGAQFFDVDKDGDQDLFVVSGGNLGAGGNTLLQPRLYINNGNGIFERDTQRLPNINVNASCLKACDYDNNGYIDIFIGGRSVPGRYGVAPNSYLLKNEHGILKNITEAQAPQLAAIGMVTDAEWVDLDMDNKKELIVVGEWMPITVFKNTGSGLVPSPMNKKLDKTSGWWNGIKAVDLDGDGDTDFVLGNTGLNTKFKIDSLHPATLYVSDFDKNGTQECVMAYYKSDGKLYPYYLRNDLVAQLPFLKKQFLKFADYAGKPIEDVFTAAQLQSAVTHEAYVFQTSIWRNNGNGTFTLQALPLRAQFAPVYGMLISDMNGDGQKDIFLAGNKTGLKPELGSYDANFGTVLLAQGGQSYEYCTPTFSGLFYKGEVRDVATIHTAAGSTAILLAMNNQPLKLFKQKKPHRNSR
jgi:hypothetical protein